MTRTFTERDFWDRVTKGDGCWLWTGAVSSTGYGKFTRHYAHRFSYELAKGPIPDGLTIDHLCRVPRCVNPDHLEAVTIGENMKRGTAPGAIVSRTNRCLRGHDMSDAYVRKDGLGRACRTCFQIRNRRLYWRNPEKFRAKERARNRRKREAAA